ncbi:hypothetical protein P3X46_012034 [Hevea brasiliensis]|uniref:Uncharacterized protein n=1 Tax=Hevea brasiliensis TaxID=3981 RepID=A0ABQ9MCW4_HEVBR|nr:hypothetical protein P3X46_012034 [Hevea brasiliensis]
MQCITSVRYSVAFNGTEVGPIIPTRGIRQAVNFGKSSTFFSQNVGAQARQSISLCLGVQHLLNQGKHLGLPSLVGCKKKEIFNFLKDRLWKRLHGWKNKLLSRARKEILIKSVVQALPTYSMSVFKLSFLTCDDLYKMMNSY